VEDERLLVHISVEFAVLGGRASVDKSKDQHCKGAVEQDQKNEGGNTSITRQPGHHDDDDELKNADSDLLG
jgi:hypothetical protein